MSLARRQYHGKRHEAIKCRKRGHASGMTDEYRTISAHREENKKNAVKQNRDNKNIRRPMTKKSHQPE